MRRSQSGFVALAVIAGLVIVAAVAMLLVTESTMESDRAGRGIESLQAEYAALAAIEHAQWHAEQDDCAAYDLPTTPFGMHSYSATFGPTAGSPVLVSATATLASGISRTISRADSRVYAPATTQAVLQPGAARGKDVWFTGNFGDRNWGAHQQLFLQQGANQRSMIAFDIEALPPGARIVSASLDLWANSVQTPGTVEVFRVTSDWTEGSCQGGGGCTADGATWDFSDGTTYWDTPGGDIDPDPVASRHVDAADSWHAFDVTDPVSAWARGDLPNYGFMLQSVGIANPQFDSSDGTTPAQHPKLTVEYLCECGVACEMPQSAGSGSVLMVVDEKTWLTPGEEQIRSWLEAWGYTVTLLSDKDNQVTYNGAFAVNDVVLVSASVAPNSLGSKVTNAPIGVVSMEGEINDELGFSSGVAWTTGDTINVAENGHFITQPFESGPLRIYDAAMEGVTVAGTPSPDLTVLGQWSGATGLATLDAGAQLTSGGTAAGRRVLLPFGRNFNPGYLNNNGRLIMLRALEWAGAAAGTTGNALMVVADPANPSSQETTRQALLDSFGYAVTLIDDDASQAVFDTEVAANDFAYVPSLASALAVGSKLVNAPIGVVNEEPLLVDDFGFGASGNVWKDLDEIDILDNTHYITQPFATGLLTITSSLQEIYLMTSNLGAGFEQLAQGFNTGVLWDATFGVIETGAELFGGGNAAGRRVQLPWSSNNFDINALNADGVTLFRRSLEWAAGAGSAVTGPIAHWKLDETSGPTAVDSEGGNDGSLNGSAYWTTGEIDGGLAFDYADGEDYVEVPNSSGLENVQEDDYTLAAWFRPNSTPPGSGSDNDANYGILIKAGWHNGIYFANGNRFAFDHQLDDGTSVSLLSTNTFSPGDFYHVAGVVDRSAGTTSLYVNGELEDTLSFTPGAAAREYGTMTWKLGIAYSGASSWGWPADGVIDDARIYDRALTAAEISDILAEGGCASTTPMLFVVGNATTPSVQESARQSLAESWCFTVTLLDDGASQAEYDAAAGAASVAYISSEADHNQVAKKLKPNPIGVVNEDPGLHNVFGFSTNRYLSSTNAALSTDVTHYIMEPFGGAAVIPYTSDQPSGAAVGTLPSGLVSVGKWASGALSPLDAVLTLETGAAISGGGTAAGRRVQMPWDGIEGGPVADVNALTADGETILKRSLEWAAGAGSGVGGGGPSLQGDHAVFMNHTEAQAASNTTQLDLYLPTGTSSGDLLIAAVATDGNEGSALSAPAGWTTFSVGEDSNGRVTLGVWWKIAGSSEPSPQTFTWSGGEQAFGWIMRFMGHDPSSPIIPGDQTGGVLTGNSQNPITQRITTSENDILVLRLGGFDDDDITIGDAGLAGHTSIAMGESGTGANSVSGGAGYLIQSTPAVVDVERFTLTNTEEFRTITLGIRPAPALSK